MSLGDFMKNFLKKHGVFLLCLIISCSCMFYYIDQKKGFHEDEMFSYGSSNYKYDNVYRSYGYAEAINDYFYQTILTGPKKISNTIDFFLHLDEYQDKFDPVLKAEIPTWRSKSEAIEYMTVGQNDIFNFFSIWYNQTRDVHPPMYYNMIHIVSSFFLNHFTKYIGFIVNLIFFIGTLLGIYKIMILEKKKKWAYPSIILYGLSMGAISTVMFQRMYMMLTCFSTFYLYFVLKYIHQNYEINKKDKIIWSIIIFMGFLTQYYFCIYIVLIFFILTFFLIKKKKWQNLKTLFLIHAIPAILGIIVFPSSIEDIFFSYRGLGGNQDHTKTFLETFFYYLNAILKSFSIPLVLFIILITLIIGRFLIQKPKQTLPKINKQKVLILTLPILGFILIVSKIAPFLGENYTYRYIMLLFPSITILGIEVLSLLHPSTKWFSICTIGIILLSGYGLVTKTPDYLFKDYEKALEIAQENEDKYFIYVFDNYFTHLTSMQEFMTYQKSLIINHNIYDFKTLKNDQELNEQQEIILCIKTWINVEEILEKITQNTDFKNVKLIASLNEEINSNYYKLTKAN